MGKPENWSRRTLSNALPKLFAGLLDAHEYCGSAAALKVAQGLGGYLGVSSKLSEAQMQQVPACRVLPGTTAVA